MKITISITKINQFFYAAFSIMALGLMILLVTFITMRLAIHGGQVEVPNLVGMTADDAQKTLHGMGLNLMLINRFYSTTIPAGHIISQTPSPGVIVRHEWEVRTIESLGPQKVSIPSVLGMTERPATIAIRKVSLDVGTLAHLPAAGDADTVLAQTPPPNAGGVDSPRVSLLLSQKEDARTAAGFVMPSVTGITLDAAMSRLSSLGMYAISWEPANPPSQPAQPAAPAPLPLGSIVVGQVPAVGHRAFRGQGVKLTVNP